MNNFKLLYENINKIRYSEYQLQPFKALNAKSVKAKRNGYLLNIEFKNIGNGYSDLFSWPELGDVDLVTQLDNIKNFKLNVHIYKSIYFAYIDAYYRAKNINIFSNLSFPKNHYTAVDFKILTLEKIENLKNEGFKYIKVKLSVEDLNENEKLFFFFNNIKNSQIKLRIDFNNVLNYELFDCFLIKFQNFLNVFDFIEDPYFMFYQESKKHKDKFPMLSLAVDRLNLEKFSSNIDLAVDFIVVKPAIQNFITKNFNLPLVITSYMDHPLGQLSALYEAAIFSNKISKNEITCGLLTHKFYEMNQYAETLTIKNTQLLPSLEGTGFGFDSFLKKEHWKELI